MLKRVALTILVICLVFCTTVCAEKSEQVTDKAAHSAEEIVFATIQPAETFAGGSGTEEDPFQIETAQQLALLAEVINKDYDFEHYDEENLYRFGHYILTADIALNDTSHFSDWETDAPEYVWMPIGIRYDFRGTFDGQGHSISGIYTLSECVYEEERSVGGLFGNILSAQIRNVFITDSMLKATDKDDAGLLAGLARKGSIIENCHVSGRVVLDHVYDGGGVVGDMYGTIQDCSFSGSIAAENTNHYVGGVCGNIRGTAVGLINYGSIEAKGNCGGVVGRISGTLRGSQNFGSITVLGDAKVGGVCSSCNDEAEMIGCVNSGNIAAEEASCVGGIIGGPFEFPKSANLITLQDCTNEGNVVGLENVGGIVGEIYRGSGSYRIQRCINTGCVTGVARVGGIAGSANTSKGSSIIQDCENQGSVNAATAESCSAGGILGLGVDPNLAWEDGDTGLLTIARCCNSGSVNITRGTAGGMVGRLMNGGYDFSIEISQCENTGTIHADDSGRLGGMLGGCYAGYVVGSGEKAAYTIRSCVNSGVLSFGDAAVNTADYKAGKPSDGEALNATEKTIVALGGSAAGGMAGASFGTVIDSCLNQGSVMLPEGMVPISTYEAFSSLTDETISVFVGGIYGLSMYRDDGDSKIERVTNCAYTDNFTTACFAPFVHTDSDVFAGNRQVTAEEAAALRAELLK